jgi:hypothetical protein
MKDFVTVYEAYDLSELQLIKHAFANADLEFRVLDELSLQTGNAAVMGYSGARVQVLSHRAGLARELLQELELAVPHAATSPEWLTAWERRTNEWFLIGSLPFPVRLLLFLFIVAVLFFAGLWWIAE